MLDFIKKILPLLIFLQKLIKENEKNIIYLKFLKLIV